MHMNKRDRGPPLSVEAILSGTVLDAAVRNRPATPLAGMAVWGDVPVGTGSVFRCNPTEKRIFYGHVNWRAACSIRPQ